MSFSVDLRLPEDPFAPAKAPRVHTDDQEMEDPLLNSCGSDSEEHIVNKPLYMDIGSGPALDLFDCFSLHDRAGASTSHSQHYFLLE